MAIQVTREEAIRAAAHIYVDAKIRLETERRARAAMLACDSTDSAADQPDTAR